MTEAMPQAALDQAHRLAQNAKRSSRWYATYLVIYAVATFVVSLIIGATASPLGVALGMGLWAVVLVALTIYAHRAKTAVKQFGLLHGLVIASWTILWIITVVVGSMFFGGILGWWIAGGIACAVPPLVGAAIVLKRTR